MSRSCIIVIQEKYVLIAHVFIATYDTGYPVCINTSNCMQHFYHLVSIEQGQVTPKKAVESNRLSVATGITNPDYDISFGLAAAGSWTTGATVGRRDVQIYFVPLASCEQ